MTEEIQKRIDAIKSKRRIFIKDQFGIFVKDCYDTDILIKKNGKYDHVYEWYLKKEVLKILSKHYYNELKNLYVENNRFWYYKNIELCNLDAEKWKKFKEILMFSKLILLQYKESLKNKELHRLTNCLRTLEGNPCEITCEKCGYENQIGANFCSQCRGMIS